MAEVGDVHIPVEVDAAVKLRIDVYHHVDHRVVDAIEKVARWLTGEPGPAVGARLTVGEAPPMTTVEINVDTANALATINFVDDKGDTNAAQPAGSAVNFTSSNEAAASIAAAPDNPLVGIITVNGEGSTDIGATVVDADGNPLLEADGVTPWAAITPTTVQVDPGAAVGAQLAVTE